jgi:hypothetical protein
MASITTRRRPSGRGSGSGCPDSPTPEANGASVTA